MLTDNTRVAEVAKGLTAAQREALIHAVDLLDHMAGEGIGCSGRDGYVFADDVLYELANAFTPDWSGDQEYPNWVRAYLEANPS